MQESLLSQGMGLMLFGMGTVFVFLAVLVVITNIMSFIMGRYFPEVAEPQSTAVPIAKSSSAAVSATTLKVIQAAIDRHRPS